MRDALGEVQSVLVLGGGSDIGRALVTKLAARRCRTVVLAGRPEDDMETGGRGGRGPRGPPRWRWCTGSPPTWPPTRRSSATCSTASATSTSCTRRRGSSAARTPSRPTRPSRPRRSTSTSPDWCRAAWWWPTACDAQGHGAIVVMGSVAGVRARKDNYVYGATKAGLDAFAQGLGDALEDTGVRVMVVRPGFVHTKMTEGMEPAPFSTTPDAVADVDRRRAGQGLRDGVGARRAQVPVLRVPQPPPRRCGARSPIVEVTPIPRALGQTDPEPARRDLPGRRRPGRGAHTAVKGTDGDRSHRIHRTDRPQPWSTPSATRATGSGRWCVPAATNVVGEPIKWDPAPATIDAERLEGLDAVVHLAGEGIGEKRWTSTQKRRILESRTQGHHGCWPRRSPGSTHRPRCCCPGSAVGYYGDTGDRPTDEYGPAGTDFPASVCVAWEAATEAAEAAGIRVVHLRTGIVLSPRGGALSRQLTPFRLGLGGRAGERHPVHELDPHRRRGPGDRPPAHLGGVGTGQPDLARCR